MKWLVFSWFVFMTLLFASNVTKQGPSESDRWLYLGLLFLHVVLSAYVWVQAFP